MHQVSKPRLANHSITEECGRPGTCRSKVGCEAIDEPCTKRIVPLGVPAAEGFCQRKSLTAPLRVQCSLPCMERILENFRGDRGRLLCHTLRIVCKNPPARGSAPRLQGGELWIPSRSCS